MYWNYITGTRTKDQLGLTLTWDVLKSDVTEVVWQAQSD